MNREDIIRMAKEAGFDALLPSEEILGRGGIYMGSDDEISDELERFAALVAAAERENVASWIASQRNDVPATGSEMAAALRARKET